MANYRIASNQIKVRNGWDVKFILEVLMLIAILFLIVNAALPRLEMLVFSGNVPVYSVFLKFAIILLLIIYILIDSRASINKLSIITVITFVCYLALETLMLSVSSSYSINLILFGYNTMYFTLIFTILCFSVRSNISAGLLTKLLIIVSIPLIGLGITQTVLNNPLLPLKSANGYFKVLVWDYFGQVRAFSLFSAPAYYASFLVFVGALVFGLFLSSRGGRKFLLLLLLAVISFSEFVSLDRTAIFAFVFCLFTVFSIYKLKYTRSHLMIVMSLSFVASLSLVFVAPLISRLFPLVFAFKDQSLLERYSEWGNWIAALLKNPVSFLIGTGIFQNGVKLTSGVIVDNMFLAVMVQIGVIGLVLVLFILFVIWRKLFEIAYNEMTPLAIAGLSLITIWPIFATFGTGLNIFPLYALLPILAHHGNRMKQ